MGNLVISNSVLEQAKISPAELRLEIAVYLMAKKRLNIEQACQLAGLDLGSFQKELAKHSVPVHKSGNTGSAPIPSGSQDAPHFLSDLVGSLAGPDGDELAEIVSREFQQIEGEW
jgi:predicted HTH domain antitoxin